MRLRLFVHRLRLGARRVFVDIDPNIDDGALSAGNPFARLFQRRAYLAGLAHRDAPTAEARCLAADRSGVVLYVGEIIYRGDVVRLNIVLRENRPELR